MPFLANTFTGTETLAQLAYGLFLGMDSAQANDLIGSLDDVRVYNRALTATDVGALYSALPPVGSSTISLGASSSALSVVQGNSVTDGITATLVTGSAVSVSFGAASLPSGVTASFSSSVCTATCSTTLTLSASSAAATGTYSITVTGTGSAPSASTTVSLTITPASSGSADITSGLAAQWKLTEGSGNFAYDTSGNGNTAALYNPYWWTTTYGMSVWFNGTANGSVPESPSLKMSNQLTVSFWLDPNSNTNMDPRVISKNYDWDVKLNGPNRNPQFTAGTQYAILNYSLPLNTWHHIVFTFSTGVLTGYVDGVPVPFLANTFTGTETLAQLAYGLFLGMDSAQANDLIGSLDDVRVYNRALTATDVGALYSALPPVGSSTISLGASSSALSVVQGNSVTDGITATLVTGSAVSVSFGAAPLPSGVTASFSSSSCTATCSTTMTLSASSAAATGTYSINVTGTGSAPSPPSTAEESPAEGRSPSVKLLLPGRESARPS